MVDVMLQCCARNWSLCVCSAFSSLVWSHAFGAQSHMLVNLDVLPRLAQCSAACPADVLLLRTCAAFPSTGPVRYPSHTPTHPTLKLIMATTSVHGYPCFKFQERRVPAGVGR